MMNFHHSRHSCGGANISSASKDVPIELVVEFDIIADHEPSTELCVWCININPTRPGCPFFVATKDSRQSRYPACCSMSHVALLRYEGVTLADLGLPYNADTMTAMWRKESGKSKYYKFNLRKATHTARFHGVRYWFDNVSNSGLSTRLLSFLMVFLPHISPLYALCVS